jgi:putative endonuclease
VTRNGARGSLGARAEASAAAFLRARGLTIVERNFRCRRGEIDLVARDGEMLVFVEVRLRSRRDYGDAAASITAAKRGRIAAAALFYLARLPHTPPCRFDAILFDALETERIEWLRDIMSV